MSNSFNSGPPQGEIPDENLIFAKPWAKTLLDKMQETTKRSILIWCNIVCRIGESTIDLDEYLRVFSEAVELQYEDLITDLDSVREKVVKKIENSLEKLQATCRDLHVDMPVFDQFNQLSLGELSKIINAKVEEYEKKAEAQRREVKQINAKIRDLAKILGRKIEFITESPLPSQREITKFKDMIEELETIKMEREERYFNMKEEIAEIVQELQQDPLLEFECRVLDLTDSEVMISDQQMAQLTSYHTRVQRDLKNVKDEIAELRLKIDNIWEKLDVDIAERDNFRQRHVGNSLKTLEALKNELKRCEVLKQANIKIFIDKQREELVNIWEKCHCTQEVRDDFGFFNSDCYTEDLFELHEREIEKWKYYYEDNREIYVNLEEHKNLWQAMLQLDSNSDSGVNRYKNRGGQLLQEEKLRNKLAKKIPKIEETLTKLALNYYERFGRNFTTHGQTIEEYIKQLHQERENALKIKLSAKKQKRDNVPSSATITRSASRMNLFGAPSMMKSGITTPSKRKLFATATTPSTEQSKKLKTTLHKKKSMSCTALPTLNVSKTRRLSKIHEERRKRLRSKKSSSSANKENTFRDDTNSTNYNLFEKEMSTRSEWRSTGFVLKEVNTNTNQNMLQVPTTPVKATPSGYLGTPRGIFKHNNETPRMVTRGLQNNFNKK